MKRRRRERLPKREAGSFPQFLYKSLDELEGVWPAEESYATSLIEQAHALHRKPLLILSGAEIHLAVQQRIEFPWTLALLLQRLREDPLREGEIGPGDLLRTALEVPRQEWGALLPELEEIANAVMPTLTDIPDDGWLEDRVVEPYRRFRKDR